MRYLVRLIFFLGLVGYGFHAAGYAIPRYLPQYNHLLGQIEPEYHTLVVVGVFVVSALPGVFVDVFRKKYKPAG